MEFKFSLQPPGSILNYEQVWGINRNKNYSYWNQKFSAAWPQSFFDHADCYTEEYVFMEAIGGVAYGFVGLSIDIFVNSLYWNK